MIHLVQDHTSFQLGCSASDGSAQDIRSLDDDLLRAPHIRNQVWYRQTSFRPHLLAFRADEVGIDHYPKRRVVFRQPVYEDSQVDVKLRRRKSHATIRLHRIPHPVDDATNLRCRPPNGFGFATKSRMRDFYNVDKAPGPEVADDLRYLDRKRIGASS